MGSDERKKFRTSMGFANSSTKQNNFSFFTVRGNFTYQPTDALLVTLSPSFSSNPNKTQYVTEKDFNSTPRYVLGTIDNQTFSTSLRLNYTINPNLSIQYYGEPFISRGTYQDFKYVTNPTADDLYDRFQQYNDSQITYDAASEVYQIDENQDNIVDYEIADPDFSFVQFRSNLVVRWEVHTRI